MDEQFTVDPMASQGSVDPEDSTAINDLARLKRVAARVRDRHEPQWRDSMEILTGEHRKVLGTITRDGSFAPQVNRTANALVITYSILTEIPVRPVIVPRSAQEADIYATAAGLEKLAAIGHEGNPSDPIPEEVVKDLMNPAGGFSVEGQAMFYDTDFIWIDNDMVADAMTEELQSQWVAGYVDKVLDHSNYEKLSIGHSDILYEWDAEEQRMNAKALHPQNVWIDPHSTGMHDANFAIIRELIQRSEAREEFPEIFSRDKEETESEDYFNTTEGTSLGTDVDEAGGDRVEKFILFERNYSVKKTQTQLKDPDDPESEKIEVGVEEQWHLRQACIIEGKVCYDEQSEFPDIPIARNNHLPLPHSPYGVGVPEYLGPMQNLYNRLWSIAYEHSLYYRSPMHIVPESLIKKLRAYLQGAYSLAGQFIPVPDESLMTFGGEVIRDIRPPELNMTFFSLISLVSEEIDRMAGLSNVLRGEAKAGWSGQLFEQATSNSQSPIGMTARNTASAVKQLMRLNMNMIAEWLPAEVLAERNRAYPLHVWVAIKNRASTMDFDFEVQVSGANKKDSDLQRLSMVTQTMPILLSSPTYLKWFLGRVLGKSEIPNADQIGSEVLAMQQSGQQSPPSPPHQGNSNGQQQQ